MKELDEAALRRMVVEEFSSPATQELYRTLASSGLWESEREIAARYFPPGARVLDLGCGTGRTTLALAALGYDILGVDVTPAMIETAREIAAERGVSVPYEVGDATALSLPDASFDAALFSYNGLMQIPAAESRGRAFDEVRRVLVPGGVFAFTALPRTLRLEWVKRFVKHFVLRPLGRPDPEREWGDTLFFRGESRKMQFLHFPSRREVARAVRRAGLDLALVETTARLGGSGGMRPTVFYVATKPRR